MICRLNHAHILRTRFRTYVLTTNKSSSLHLAQTWKRTSDHYRPTEKIVKRSLEETFGVGCLAAWAFQFFWQMQSTFEPVDRKRSRTHFLCVFVSLKMYEKNERKKYCVFSASRRQCWIPWRQYAHRRIEENWPTWIDSFRSKRRVFSRLTDGAVFHGNNSIPDFGQLIAISSNMQFALGTDTADDHNQLIAIHSCADFMPFEQLLIHSIVYAGFKNMKNQAHRH